MQRRRPRVSVLLLTILNLLSYEVHGIAVLCRKRPEKESAGDEDVSMSATVSDVCVNPVRFHSKNCCENLRDVSAVL